jgi:condensation domain-containing protein
LEPTRFNVFQRVLRHWDALHAYNAAQVLHLRGVADVQMLTDRWNQTLRALGIGAVHVEGRRFWIDRPNHAEQPVATPQLSLEDFMTEEMNRPFAPTGGLPFRPFVIEQNGSYLAGVVYHHWVADSASIRMIVREWFVRMFDPSKARNEPVPIATRGYWHYFGPSAARWEFDKSFMTSASWFSRFRRVRRIESPGVHDFTMRFTLHRFPDGAIEQIRTAARKQNVTVNDFFLAAMAQACDAHVPALHTFRRHDLALGTIVDLRTRGHNTVGERFGLFLGFTSIFIRPHELRDFSRMVQGIQRQTLMHKVTHVPESSMIRMAGGLIFHRLFGDDPKKLVEFYRKRFPLCAGISNINLNGSWVQEYHPDPLLEYIRVSPTGPMMPVVFTTTTLGDQLHFGLGTRDSIVSPDDAQKLADAFRNIVLQNS